MKNKAPLLFLALTAAVLALARPAAANPFDSFTLVMDRLCGPGQWSAQSHAVSADGLTVKGLTAKLLPSLGNLSESPPPALTVDSVFIKNIPDRAQMEKLMALTDWQGQPGLTLAEVFTIKGLRQAVTQAEGELELAIEEINLEGLKLAQADPRAPAGPAGFLRALRAATAGYKNLRLALKSPEANAVAAVESGLIKDLSFGGAIPPDLAKLLDAKLDPDGLFKEFGGQSFKNLKVAGLKLDFQGRAPEGKFQGSLSLGSLEEADVQVQSVGSLQLNDFQSRLTDFEGRVFRLNLASFNLRGLDMSQYLAKVLPFLVEAQAAEAENDPDKAAALLLNQFFLADFFISPIALEEMTLTGLDLDSVGLVSVKIAEAKSAGPYRIGEVPPTAMSWLKGLEINLSGDPQAEEGTPGRDIYEFCQKIGRTNFALDAEFESAYEAGTGLLTAKLNHLTARDLFALSSSFTWGGLTSDRLEKFKTIPLSAFQLAAQNPGELLGEASFNAANIKYTDQGLIDLAFNLAAQSEGVSGPEMKEGLLDQAGLILPALGAQYIKNSQAFSLPLLNFLQTPKSLEIDIKAAPPLTFKVVEGLKEDPADLLDALNITFSANGEPGSPLRFKPGLSGRPGPGE